METVKLFFLKEKKNLFSIDRKLHGSKVWGGEEVRGA